MTTPTFELRWTCTRCQYVVPLMPGDGPFRNGLTPEVTAHHCFPDPPEDGALMDLYCGEDSVPDTPPEVTVEDVGDELPPLTPDQLAAFDLCALCEHEGQGVHWCDKRQDLRRKIVRARKAKILPPLPTKMVRRRRRWTSPAKMTEAEWIEKERRMDEAA